MKRGKPKTDAPQKAETKFAVRNGSEQPAKKDKAVKDPYKTKRPPSAFVLFMKGFRKAYNEKHPHNKSVTVVCKAGGDKWRTMSEEDKAPFVAKANRLKTEYGNKLASYNKSQSVMRKEASRSVIQLLNNCGPFAKKAPASA